MDCGVPDSPINGTLGNYSNTEVGATVSFRCNEGFHPPDVRVSVCSDQGLWTPFPQEHNCRGKENHKWVLAIEQASCVIIVDCGVPDPPMNGTLGNYSHTEVGATVQFWCNEGFHPPDTRDSVCSNQGVWIPLTQEHNCRGKKVNYERVLVTVYGNYIISL